MSDSLHIRVYYEDTDLAGIVYYANYLKFIERGRSEWVRARGLDQSQIKRDHGMVFAVRKLEADYLKPARFDDLLEVQTDLVALGGARIEMKQQIWCSGALIFTAHVTLACLSETGRAMGMPKDIRAHFSPHLQTRQA